MVYVVLLDIHNPHVTYTIQCNSTLIYYCMYMGKIDKFY